MDNKAKKIQEEVEKTMNSLNRLPRLDGNPFLFTRIEERMKGGKKATPSWSFASLLQPAIVSSLLLINIWTAYNMFNNSTTTEEIYTDVLANDYSYMDDQSLEYYIPE